MVITHLLSQYDLNNVKRDIFSRDDVLIYA